MPTTLTNGIQLPDKGSVDWYNSMQSNYNLIDTHLGNTDTHVTAEDKANWNSKQGSLSQAQLDAIAQVSTNTSDIATLQSGKANASHTHSSSDITDIGDYATKQYVDNSISGLVDNAPDALNTLNELSAALNDDSNFASTVATALSAKANSADLATVATSGSYNDLSNKPSIPTKTSDLTNDSNFVDTSNSAVASGITSAKVTAYDSHIADTDIHVTTADKTKWNNNVTQSYVFRYSSTAVVPNSTIAYSTIDNTDNIKSGDKILDVDGKLFEITAVDATNETVTVGSALIDLALDANVVHTSGNETVGGNKTFVDNIIAKKIVSNVSQLQINAKTNADSVAMIGGDSASEGGGVWIYGKNSSNKSMVTLQVYDTDNSAYHAVRLNMDGSLTPTVSNNGLGSSSYKWVSFNGLNPSSLGMPDLSNGVDISGYLTVGTSTNDSYTAPANGYIGVIYASSSSCGCYVYNYTDGVFMRSNSITDSTYTNVCGVFIPILKNQTMNIASRATESIVSAKFIPCQGNI